jgi:hypothetical protein
MSPPELCAAQVTSQHLKPIRISRINAGLWANGSDFAGSPEVPSAADHRAFHAGAGGGFGRSSALSGKRAPRLYRTRRAKALHYGRVTAGKQRLMRLHPIIVPGDDPKCKIGLWSTTFAQAPAGAASSSVLPTGGGAALLDPSDTAMLLLDHQAGLFQTVKDIPISELRSNVVMLAKLAKLMNCL